jgi:uroporphyrin-III C-methyltransferase/precorrin-2 dehydrogenase/sirohydrochlorin ferrochelatase
VRYFPLFADLHGRRVLVVGGGAVAERKVRLLLEAGAAVVVVAPRITQWLRERAEDAAGSLTYLAGHFQPAHFDGAVLVVTATDDHAVNSLVAATGRERNVLVNVVDVAELSTFIVPAIVDRSPLVIAISTGGVAPVLARLVRERIEALFDNSFGSLAGLLEQWRGRIKRCVPDVAARRRFYETVVRGAVAALVRPRNMAGAEH